MKLILGTFTALGLAVAAPLAPAAAQAQAAISAGMAITDPSGAAVGTVFAVKGDNLLVKTDKHEVLLPKSSFSVSEGKLLFGMTQAQLNAKIEESLSAADASIVAGATVKGSGGVEIGKIETVDADKVTIALTSGKKIQVTKTSLRGNTDGTVTTGYTAEQLQAATEGAETGQTSGQ